jgi:hypothetical protein
MIDWNNLPEWMQDYTSRDLNLMHFAIENAEAFYAINPNHPLAIHCMEMKMLVEAANAVEARENTEHKSVR